MSKPTVHAELAAAVRLLNAEFSKLPADARHDVAAWGDWDAALETALHADDHDAAIAEIHRWRDRHLAAFEGAGR